MDIIWAHIDENTNFLFARKYTPKFSNFLFTNLQVIQALNKQTSGVLKNLFSVKECCA